MLFLRILALVVFGLCFPFSLFAQDWQGLSKKDVINYYEVKEAFEEKEKAGKLEEEEEEHFEKFESFILQNMDENGNYDSKKESNSFLKFLNNSSNLRQEAASNWSFFGPVNPPGPDGYNNDGMGRVDVVAFHPSDTNIVFVGSPSGGLWKSTNRGKGWNCLSNSWLAQGVADVAIEKNNPNTMYVATGDRDNHRLNAVGVLKTTDGGLNWTNIGLANESFMHRLLLNPKNSKSMLVATGSGLFRTVDGGLNWAKASEISASVLDIEYMPNDTNVVIAVTKNALFKSTNGAKTFTSYTTPYASAAYNTNITVSNASPNEVWVFVASTSYDLEGLYTFSQTTNSFTKILTGVENVYNVTGTSIGTTKSVLGAQGFYDWVVQVDPLDKNRIILGGVDMIMTVNGGAKWFQASDSYIGMGTHVDYHAIAFQPLTNKLYVGSDGGLYRAEKSASPNQPLYNWIQLNDGLTITQQYQIALSLDGKKLLSGSQDNGMHKYNNAPEWDYLSIGDAFGVGFDNVDSNLVFGALQNGYVFTIENGSQRTISTSTVRGETGVFQTKMVVDPNLKHTAYVIYKNLWKTNDAGTTWTNLTASLGLSTSFSQVAIAISDSKIVYTSNGANLYYSNNAGTSWTKRTFPSNLTFTNDIEICDNNPNKIWLASSNGNISESTDGGINWTNISFNLPAVTIYKIQYISGSINSLIIGTSKGIFARENNASSWTLLNSGLPTMIINDLAVDPCTGVFYAATYGRGVWKGTFSGLNVATSCCRRAPNLNVSNAVLCDGQTSTITTSTQLPSGYKYNWSQDGAILNATGNTISTTQAGEYQLNLSNSTSLCSTVSASANIKSLGASTKVPICIDFESGLGIFDLSKQNSAVPFALLDNATCTSNGKKILSFITNTSNNGFNGVENKAIFRTKALNLSNMLTASLSFGIAYRNNIYSNSGTKMEVYISTDCGVKFTRIDSVSHTKLAKNTEESGSWTSTTCNDWKTFTYDLSKYNKNNTIISLEFSIKDYPGQVAWGGDLYMDNICISGVTGIEDISSSNETFNLVPNPTTGYVEVVGSFEIKKIEVIDVMGKTIISTQNQSFVNVEKLNAGQYIVKIESKSATYTSKIIKQ